MDNRFSQSKSSGDANASVNREQAQASRRSARKSISRGTIYSILLLGVGCLLLALVGLFATSYPVLASWVPGAQPEQKVVQQIQHPQSFAQVSIPKPTYTPTAGLQAFQPPVFTPTATLEVLPSLEFSIVQPTEFPTQILQAVDNQPQVVDNSQLAVDNSAGNSVDNTLPTVNPVDNSGTIYAEIVPDTPTPEYVAATTQPELVYAPVTGNGEHWIDVDLSQQRVYAYEGDIVVNSFVVSTGTWQTPTVTGKYKVWIKLLSTSMSGPGYYVPDVPYVMYFYKGYGLHGTYWHNNFGTPMSHGCVNLTVSDAQWLYNFSSVGTVVNVHY